MWFDSYSIQYNIFDSNAGSYQSVLRSVEGELIEAFDQPLQAIVSSDFFLSLNYRRLHTLRPDYGYRNLPCMSLSELLDHDTDGIWLTSYKTRSSTLIISLASVIQQAPYRIYPQSLHLFNHIIVNPSGDSFVFLHRFFHKGVRFDYMWHYSLSSGILKFLPSFGLVSHYCWLDFSKLLVYMSNSNSHRSFQIVDTNSGT